jgi:cardiolipin synthase
MRKLLNFLTSRFFILTLVLVLELVIIVGCSVLIVIYSPEYGYYFLMGAWILNLPTLIFVINSKANTSYKLGWMLIVALVPICGILLYILFANKRDTKRQREKLRPYTEALRKYNKPRHLLDEIKSKDEVAY